MKQVTPLSNRVNLTLGLLVLIGVIASMALVASVHNHLLQQGGGPAYLAELMCVLCVYAAAIILATSLANERWSATLRSALPFGLLSALIEAVNIALENIAPNLVGRPSVSISFMLVTFLIWAAAAFACDKSTPWQTALLPAVESAGICMLIAVTFGFLIELYLRPPDAEFVSTWIEYKRSGWSDARVFALANTLESGTTHLLFGPFVATLFGGTALAIKRAFSIRPA